MGADCKSVAKASRFESLTRHHHDERPLTCENADRGRSCRSDVVRLNPVLYGWLRADSGRVDHGRPVGHLESTASGGREVIHYPHAYDLRELGG